MAKHITAFVLDRIAGTDEARVRCRVKWDGSRQIVAVNIGYRVNVLRWDAESQHCVPRSYHGRSRTPSAEINGVIDQLRLTVDTYFLSAEAPSADDLRELLQKIVRPEGAASARESRRSVFVAYDAFMAERGERNKWTDATLKKMMNVRRHLKEWREDLKWEDLDEAGLFSYMEHLRTATQMDNKCKRKDVGSDEVTERRKGLRDSTVEKHLAMLKWFLGWAENKGFLTCYDYRTFRPKLQKVENPVIFLEWDELMTLYNIDLEERPDLARVRDVFAFCAFTSLRYSDVKALRWADVSDTCITVTTQKTSDALRIELNDYSSELIGRYVDEAFPDDRVFPVLSNQKMNDRLKELGQLCGFDRLIRITEFRNGKRQDSLVPKWKLLGTHAARRTFICNALMMGIAPNIVMRWTGHADYDSMKPYIAVADSVKAKAMAKFNRPK